VLCHAKALGMAQVAKSVWKKLTQGEKQEIERFCDKKLEQYDQRFRAILIDKIMQTEAYDGQREIFYPGQWTG